MSRTTLLVLILSLAAASPLSAQVVYDKTSGRLSATYHGAPLRDVLAEISRKTGIAVYIDPAVDKVVFIEKKRRPVDEVLQDIVTPLNSMFIYRGDVVTAVKIYEQTPADAMQRIGAGTAPKPAAEPVQRTSPPAAPPEVRRGDRPGAIDAARDERMKKTEERRAERRRMRRAAQPPEE